ncbi:MAG: hypothetical protein KVP17_003128 [Porospora cf. gigantea B]|uniref:uncharacterized protein n=1 Tax=Porospora cf. gigantea B TaxID=2853592 RepID=UPI003571E6DB|nr:MAG: hypothetical protein KVP17_003128 [Porospora cf. gigantea B]
MSKVCTLCIHTNATEEYAQIVADILDPDRAFFGDRIAARDTFVTNDLRKDMSRLLPDTDPREIVILDDRDDVWSPIFHSGLIKVLFYNYFETHKRQISTAFSRHSSLLAPTFVKESPLEDLDYQLPYLQSVLTEVCSHYLFLAKQGYEPHVGELLQSRKRCILSGCTVLLTGFNKMPGRSEHGLHDSGPMFKDKLLAMGAEVVEGFGLPITHILVMRSTQTTELAK